MMSMTCHNLLDLVACGCSSNASFDRSSVRKYGNANTRSRNCRDFAARRLFCFRRDIASCRVSSTKTPNTLLDDSGIGQNPSQLLNLKEEPRGPISLANLFEVVADDLQTLNQNLRTMNNLDSRPSGLYIRGQKRVKGSEAKTPHIVLNTLIGKLRKHVWETDTGADNPVLMSAADQIFGAGGKRMRPALVFLVSRATAEIMGLKELTREHRRLAEIIEMIHTASLIHDDVLDDSDMRRGKETVHQIFGTRIAVLAGDFMFAQSSWYLANLENLEVIKLISQVIKDFASGEIKQASSLFDCDTELEEYLIKSYYKTASLIAASTKGAAIFSGVDSNITGQMYEYGRNLGLSFQVVDDILDFTQSAEQLGKPAGSDLVKGNLTAPVIFALEKEPKLREIIESEFCETGSLDEAIRLVKSCGGIERAQQLAKEKADLAIQNLRCLPESAFSLALEDMVMYNLERID